MGLTVTHHDGLHAFTTSVGAFTDAATAVDELGLFAPSRCTGWSRFDVVAHVLAGWQELLGGFACRTDGPASVDAASYWTAYAAATGDTDPVAALMDQRRHTDAHRRPATALARLRDVADQLLDSAPALPDGHHAFQGHVFASGDLLASWAVEDVVHLLDLDTGATAPTVALELARRTAAALPDGSPWRTRFELG